MIRPSPNFNAYPFEDKLDLVHMTMTLLKLRPTASIAMFTESIKVGTVQVRSLEVLNPSQDLEKVNHWSHYLVKKV